MIKELEHESHVSYSKTSFCSIVTVPVVDRTQRHTLREIHFLAHWLELEIRVDRVYRSLDVEKEKTQIAVTAYYS